MLQFGVIDDEWVPVDGSTPSLRHGPHTYCQFYPMIPPNFHYLSPQDPMNSQGLWKYTSYSGKTQCIWILGVFTAPTAFQSSANFLLEVALSPFLGNCHESWAQVSWSEDRGLSKHLQTKMILNCFYEIEFIIIIIIIINFPEYGWNNHTSPILSRFSPSTESQLFPHTTFQILYGTT